MAKGPYESLGCRYTMAKLTVQDAEALADKGRPWTFRMEDANGWWLATGRAKDEPAEIHTSTGPLVVVDWDEVERQALDNEGHGWDYKWTSFVKVSPQTIADHEAKKASSGHDTIRVLNGDFWLMAGNTPQQITQTDAQMRVQAGTATIKWGF